MVYINVAPPLPSCATEDAHYCKSVINPNNDNLGDNSPTNPAPNLTSNLDVNSDKIVKDNDNFVEIVEDESMNNTDSATGKKRKNIDVGINATKQQNCKIAKQLSYEKDDNSVDSVHDSLPPITSSRLIIIGGAIKMN